MRRTTSAVLLLAFLATVGICVVLDRNRAKPQRPAPPMLTSVKVTTDVDGALTVSQSADPWTPPPTLRMDMAGRLLVKCVDNGTELGLPVQIEGNGDPKNPLLSRSWALGVECFGDSWRYAEHLAGELRRCEAGR